MGGGGALSCFLATERLHDNTVHGGPCLEGDNMLRRGMAGGQHAEKGNGRGDNMLRRGVAGGQHAEKGSVRGKTC
jgi:hypothetical protein